MKHVVLALLVSLGLLASGCVHGGSGRGRNLDPAATLALAGIAAVGLVVIIAAQSSGGPECTDPLGRCGSYSPPPPESR